METLQQLPSMCHSNEKGHRRTDPSKSKWNRVKGTNLLLAGRCRKDSALIHSATGEPLIPVLWLPAYISRHVPAVWPGGVGAVAEVGQWLGFSSTQPGNTGRIPWISSHKQTQSACCLMSKWEPHSFTNFLTYWVQYWNECPGKNFIVTIHAPNSLKFQFQFVKGLC